ncbi:DNA recombination protein RmuC [Campylobacter sp. US33a]|uniref:DNA recombination protein RmuC n=1 Tax=Campylobacter sp. CCS1377 TaxID=3158229 RepID=A0AAU7E5U0_9BACT|nr:DNA recombination protein RmuC [Campylobacter sp. US33a]TEY03045.1 DNA recombination protein RmuC [Campylobacter sp. US33a]
MLYELSLILAFLCLLLISFIWIKSSSKNTEKENAIYKEKIQELLNQLQEIKIKEEKLIQEKIQLISKCEVLENKNSEREKLKESYERKLLDLENKLNQKESEKEELLKSYAQEKEKIKEDYQCNLTLLEKKFEENLKNQNSTLINQNKIILNEDVKKLLEEIFLPVKKSVKEYSERLNHNEISLKTHIENMFKFSQNMGENADKLAKILKGDKKIRGNFAELQLKSVLENSGLVEGLQYKLQEKFKDEGKTYIPDAIVFLDKQKSIIIDAKFSLPSDFSFEELDLSVCKELAFNLKARIDELAKKPYAQFDKHTHEFVLLFVPYQNILDLILSVDASIYQYAYQKKVYLTTPNTLFMALNTIDISWKNIQSNENILKAFEELGKFHDKFAGVLEDFDKIKNNIKSLNTNIDNMQTKLNSGSGNLASRVVKLKELGAKTNKLITCEFSE